jgi:hypothetical protein
MEYVMSTAIQNLKLMSQEEIVNLVNTFYDRLDTALCQDVTDLHRNHKISDEVFKIYLSDAPDKMARVEKLYQLFLNKREKWLKDHPYESIEAFDDIYELDAVHFRDIDPIRDMRKSYKVARELPPILIWGSPGIGKSEIVRSIAKQRGISLIDIRLAQRDAIDIKGIPTPNEYKRRTIWYLSGEWPDCPISKGIIFFDELTAADKPVQVSAYEIILERKLGEPDRDGYALPNGWYIASAGNLKSDDAKSEPMSSALANRLLHIEIDVDAKNWLTWARNHGVHPSVVNFVEKGGSTNAGPDPRWLLHNMGKGNTQAKLREAGEDVTKQQKNIYDVDKERGWPSPRSWDRVSSIVYTYEEYMAMMNEDNRNERNRSLHASGYPSCNVLQIGVFSQDVFRKVINGLIGNYQGQRFYSYYVKFRSLADLVVKILNGADYQKTLEIRDIFFVPKFDSTGLIDKNNPFSDKIDPSTIDMPQVPQRSNPAKKKQKTTPKANLVQESLKWRKALVEKDGSVSSADFLEFALAYYSQVIYLELNSQTRGNEEPQENPTWALDIGAFIDVLTVHLFADSLLGSTSEDREAQVENAFTAFWIILQILCVINLHPQAMRAYSIWNAYNDKLNLTCRGIIKKTDCTPFETALVASQSTMLKSTILNEKRNFIRISNHNLDRGATGYILEDANVTSSPSKSSNASKNVNKAANGTAIPLEKVLKGETRRSEEN